ncbi:MAG TPA: chloride channel protein [Hanamia sp.]|nr:chloride channel protein [Hanamia sp.]
MKSNEKEEKRIPVSVSLQSTLQAEDITSEPVYQKQRVLTISVLSVLIAFGISFIAKFLVYLIDLVTNISFFGTFSIANHSPADNTLGWWVVLLPALGGVVVGLMALYGSKAIRGHGIPEAMETILTNQSKVKPTVTYLKPISSAIAIGTGGPFGAEGPIIATGGALGSTIGQILRITPNERKILLTAGSTAGMAAIFGSPVAGIFLGIELLLFEFSPRSIIPVTLACVTGAAGHHLLFGSNPVFGTDVVIQTPGNTALIIYSVIGIFIGLASVGVTRLVYAAEDAFEKIPIHWMWWPALGGLVVGFVGYFAPHTLGVGYDNITNILTGRMTLTFLVSICLLKFISWCIALGSGTSGGTLAPLFIIGGAAGALIGNGILYWFPSSGISVALCALVGMAAMFTGASRAFLTSVIFAIETTGQTNALLPLLGACGGSYIVSFFLMNNTIMTEKISRRGVKTPDSYEPDLLEKVNVSDVMLSPGEIINSNSTIKEVLDKLQKTGKEVMEYFIVSDDAGKFKGLLKFETLYNRKFDADTPVGEITEASPVTAFSTDTLRRTVERMAAHKVDVLPVTSGGETITGIISFRSILEAYQQNSMFGKNQVISLKRRGLRVIAKGKRRWRNFDK